MVPTGAPKLTLWPLGSTISLFSIGVTCRFSSSQSLSFTSTAATDWAMPAEAQETTVLVDAEKESLQADKILLPLAAIRAGKGYLTEQGSAENAFDF